MADKIADSVGVFKGEDDKWYVHTLSAENGRIILSSEGYENKSHADDVANDTGLIRIYGGEKNYA